jgi:protocatechuate 3,4-dioxygenase alpha subunit
VAEATPSQTVGPFFSLGLCARDENELAEPGTPGAVLIEGVVYDGEGEPVPDALLEIWLGGEDAAGWGRCGTDLQGRYRFVTPRPLPYGGQAPHLSVLVFARGLLKPVLTRIYFPDDEANASDPLLASLSETECARLVAEPSEGGLRFDVHLQGERQTTFFAL